MILFAFEHRFESTQHDLKIAVRLATLYNRRQCDVVITFTYSEYNRRGFPANRSRPGTSPWFTSAPPIRMIYGRESSTRSRQSICNCLFPLIDCDLSWFPTRPNQYPRRLAVIIQRQASICYVMAVVAVLCTSDPISQCIAVSVCEVCRCSMHTVWMVLRLVTESTRRRYAIICTFTQACVRSYFTKPCRAEV